MGMLCLEKSWRPITTLEVDGQHRDEVMLGIDGQNPNQREIMLLHHAHNQMQIKLDIWHKPQSKAKSWKRRHLVTSTSMALGDAIKKQGIEPLIELRFSGIPTAPSLSYPHRPQDSNPSQPASEALASEPHPRGLPHHAYTLAMTF
ncbi:hypothetical protein H4582DRAFT_2072085 [Lactarius indigo]|nr:hypothetical protein H4582DRAFT_2072085 [Lactarius indigo]